MPGEADFLWVLVIAASALVGWWISVRPGSSYRGAAAGMSGLIMVMAILMCMLALQGQGSTSTSKHAFMRSAAAATSANERPSCARPDAQ